MRTKWRVDLSEGAPTINICWWREVTEEAQEVTFGTRYLSSEDWIVEMDNHTDVVCEIIDVSRAMSGSILIDVLGATTKTDVPVYARVFQGDQLIESIDGDEFETVGVAKPLTTGHPIYMGTMVLVGGA